MEPKLFEEFVKALSSLSPEEHAKLFDELRQITYDRLSKEAEVFAVRSKELQEFIKEKLTNK